MNSVEGAIILHPRPYEIGAGSLLLLPLLPQPKRSKPLPAEIWSEIFAFAFTCEVTGYVTPSAWAWTFLGVCKSFAELSLPLLYASVVISQIESLELLYKRLYSADQRWDSIRRIPYSSPGRWIQLLDLSDLAFHGQFQAVLFDSLLTRLFPLLPFLANLHINPSFLLSRSCLTSLANREGSKHLRCMTGLSYISPPEGDPAKDPFVILLRQCPNLKELSIVGQGLDPAEMEFNFSGLLLPSTTPPPPLSLPKLTMLSILSMPFSPLMFALFNSSLPSLKKLTMTPYHDIPYPASLVSCFISTHGRSLTSLNLFTPKSWPTRLHPSPSDILKTSPDLNHLSLENPLPHLILSEKHGLKILSIPRPQSDFWFTLDRLLPMLPDLAVLRARDVRWLRRGISSRAQEAGVQGEMREWERRLARRNIRLVDCSWRSSDCE